MCLLWFACYLLKQNQTTGAETGSGWLLVLSVKPDLIRTQTLKGSGPIKFCIIHETLYQIRRFSQWGNPRQCDWEEQELQPVQVRMVVTFKSPHCVVVACQRWPWRRNSRRSALVIMVMRKALDPPPEQQQQQQHRLWFHKNTLADNYIHCALYRVIC